MTISREEIAECEEVKVRLLVKPGTKINFDNGNCLMVAKSEYTGTVKAIKSAEYLGEGSWCVDKEIRLKSPDNGTEDTE